MGSGSAHGTTVMMPTMRSIGNPVDPEEQMNRILADPDRYGSQQLSAYALVVIARELKRIRRVYEIEHGNKEAQ
jgi:hypothetical protein